MHELPTGISADAVMQWSPGIMPESEVLRSLRLMVLGEVVMELPDDTPVRLVIRSERPEPRLVTLMRRATEDLQDGNRHAYIERGLPSGPTSPGWPEWRVWLEFLPVPVREVSFASAAEVSLGYAPGNWLSKLLYRLAKAVDTSG